MMSCKYCGTKNARFLFIGDMSLIICNRCGFSVKRHIENGPGRFSKITEAKKTQIYWNIYQLLPKTEDKKY